MMRTTKITAEHLDFIEELADRFPDLSDLEVLNAYFEYTSAYFDGDTIDGRVVLYAYNHGAVKAADYAKTVWGVTLSAGSTNPL